ncbi:site-specific integrase [Vreelandella rituensis]|uniref:Site-specific integrase n=1 Tax=Vreelandella rituensis TaxID=2282306 RepID=A0A368U4S6_9GAMM|nr:site-specific integrase [Halomonas rituensis]RCV92035.1 site-specific integrase [Halomonas rituensis]
MRVEAIRQPAGHEVPLLIDEDDMPIPSANEFILARQHLKPNTLIRNARELMPFFEWLQAQRVDLWQRVSSGLGFTEAEIVGSLFFMLRRDRARGKVKKLVVEPATFNQRLLTTAAFLRWYFNTCLVGMPSEHRLRERVKENQARIASWFNEGYISAAPTARASASKSLTDQEQAFLIECLNPIHGKGIGKLTKIPPFKKGATPAQKKSRQKAKESRQRQDALGHRNFVAMLLMLQAGLRRGELLSLRVEDVVVSSASQVNVVVRPPDPNDTRRPRPEVKRNARPIFMSPIFARAVDEYITEWRPILLDRAEIDNDYLILSGGGEPLSLARLNKIFEQLRKAYPGRLPAHLSPHTLRHRFSQNLERSMREAGMGEEERKKALAIIRGDSSLESQNVYIEAEVHKQASKVLARYQEKTMLITEDVPF